MLLFIASGYFSNPAKEYLEKYRHSRKPRFRIKTWELPQIEHITNGRRSLLYRYDLIKEQYKIRPIRQIRRAENEFYEKMWYGRSGDVDKTALDPEVKRRVKRSKREIEKKYGKKNLFVNDFGWGMFNGKLSALRWVLGDEWDVLDT